MIFNPAEYSWNPDVMEAQRELERASQPDPVDFFSMFSGGFDLSTDTGRQAWATSGISGLLLSKLYGDESQKEWFIQRNAIDLGYKDLEELIAAYEKIAKVRELDANEQAQFEEAVKRRDTVQRDLGHVFDNYNGDLDAAIDTNGKSFNQRWGLEDQEEGAFSDFIDMVAQHPGAMTGALTAEIIKDLPLVGLAKLLGIAHKGLSMGQIIKKVNDRLNNIKPKLLRGLAKVSTGVGAGAAAGALYEGVYTTAEQGTPKPKAIVTGAKFGATFGVLGGLGLLAKGPVGSKTTEVAEEAATVVKPEVKPAGDLAQLAEKVASENKEALSKAADDANPFPDVEQKIDNASTPKGPAIISNFDAETNRVGTVIDEAALRKEQQDTIKELKQAIKNNTEFRGVPASKLTSRVFEQTGNFETFKMFRLAQEKAKAKLIFNARQKNLPDPEGDELEALSRIATFNELNRIDAERLGIKTEQPKGPSNAQLEADAILKQRRNDATYDGETRPPKEGEEDVPINTPVQDFLAKRPKTGLALGAGLGYVFAGEEDKTAGVAVGLAAAALGPRAYKGLQKGELKRSAIRVKYALSKDIDRFSKEAKVLEAEMQFVLNEIETKFVGKKAQLNLIDSIEQPDTAVGKKALNNLTGEQLKIKEDLQNVLSIIGDAAVAAGVLKNKKGILKLELRKLLDGEDKAHLLNNYFPHLFRKDLDEAVIQDLIKYYNSKSNNEKFRKLYDTIEEFKNDPKFADIIIDDPVRALTTYVQAMSRTIYARNLINSMYDLDVSPTGQSPLPALMSKKAFRIIEEKSKKFDELKQYDQGGLSPQQLLNYTEFDHPTLKGYVAHTDVKQLIDDQFAVIRRGGVSDFWEGLLKLNNGLKRIFIFGSLFHGQALVLSMVYTLGPFGMFRNLGTKADGTKVSLRDLDLKGNDFKELAKDAIRAGLTVVNVKRADLVNPGFADVEKVLERMGVVGQAGNAVFKKLDYITWEWMHDRFKVAAWLRQKEILMKRDGLEPEAAGRVAATFANDAFGSLNWEGFATSLYKYAQNNPNKLRGVIAEKTAAFLPVNKRRFLNLGLFAPDWTISNLRIVGRTFSLGGKILSNKFLEKIHKGDDAAWNSKEGKEIVAAFKLHAAYTGRAALITSGMWWTISQMFADDEPTWDGLFDFWFGDDSGKLQLGGGESMVISKQIAEPYHWLQHPRHTLLNKASIVPKTLIEGMFNKQWISVKKGFPMGPAIADENGNFTASWLVGKAIPISMKPLIDPNLPFLERLERFLTGFIGLPQYNPPKGDYFDIEWDADKIYNRDNYDSMMGYFE